MSLTYIQQGSVRHGTLSFKKPYGQGLHKRTNKGGEFYGLIYNYNLNKFLMPIGKLLEYIS